MNFLQFLPKERKGTIIRTYTHARACAHPRACLFLDARSFNSYGLIILGSVVSPPMDHISPLPENPVTSFSSSSSPSVSKNDKAGNILSYIISLFILYIFSLYTDSH